VKQTLESLCRSVEVIVRCPQRKREKCLGGTARQQLDDCSFGGVAQTLTVVAKSVSNLTDDDSDAGVETYAFYERRRADQKATSTTQPTTLFSDLFCLSSAQIHFTSPKAIQRGVTIHPSRPATGNRSSYHFRTSFHLESSEWFHRLNRRECNRTGLSGTSCRSMALPVWHLCDPDSNLEIHPGQIKTGRGG
jgi:hypothetical protein